MINKIVTLENNDKYLIIAKEIINSNEFLIGIKLLKDKYENEFKFFIEKKKENEIYLEEIKDDNLIQVIVNAYILDNA